MLYGLVARHIAQGHKFEGPWTCDAEVEGLSVRPLPGRMEQWGS